MRTRTRRAPPLLVGLVALGALGVGAVAAPSASARSYYDDDYEEPVEVPVVPSVSPSSFGGVVGLAAVERDVKSPDARVRGAAVARAAEMGRDAGRVRERRTAELKGANKSIDEKGLAEDAAFAGARTLEDRTWLMVENAALDGASDDLDGALLVRLVAVRALVDDPRAKLAKQRLRDVFQNPAPTARSSYVPPAPVPPWMPSPPPMPPPPPRTTRLDGELVRLVRDTAAIALARIGDQEWLFQQATEKPDAQRAALIAFAVAPGATLPLKPSATLNARTVELLVASRDLRAADLLVGVAKGKEPISAAMAMRALAEMGDGRVAPIAREALSLEGTADVVVTRVAATEALAILREPGADDAIRALAADKRPAASREAVRIAVRNPTAGLVPLLGLAAKAGDPAAIAALGRAGAAGVPTLLEIAKSDANGAPADAADAAAYALATCPVSEAADALGALVEGDRSATSASRRRRAVRGGAVRAARLGSAPRSVRKEAEALRGSPVEIDRWLSALLPAVLDAGDARDLLRAKDVVQRRAAAVGLGAHPAKKAAEVARAHLASATDEDAQVVRALAALAARDVDGSPEHDVPVSTSTLAVWLSEDGEAAGLAAFLLAARGGDVARPFVARALGSDDLAIRGAALLGLGVSPDRRAIGELVARYGELGNERLRRAAVRALVARGDLAAKGALDRARRFDPDASVRAMSASVVLGPKSTPASPLSRGSEVLQTKLVLASAPGALGASIRATIGTSDGFTAPALADPDGVVLAFRVPAGETQLLARPVAIPPVAKPPAPPPPPGPTVPPPPIAPAASALPAPAAPSTSAAPVTSVTPAASTGAKP
jgi:hypothetical protein